MRYYITPEDYEIAEKNGISKMNVYNRVTELGWPIQRAITEKVRIQNKGYRELLKDHNINYNTFISRLRKGLSVEQALTMKVMTPEEKVKVRLKNIKRTFTDEELEIARKNGINKRALYWRVHVGRWSKEKAIHTPTLTKKEAAQRRAEKFRERSI